MCVCVCEGCCFLSGQVDEILFLQPPLSVRASFDIALVMSHVGEAVRQLRGQRRKRDFLLRISQQKFSKQKERGEKKKENKMLVGLFFF